MKTEIVSIMAVCFCALSVPPAKAAIVTIEIEAEIDSVSDPYNFFDSNIKVGDIIKGTYSYDTSTPDSSSSVTVGRYEYSPPNTHGISLSIGSFGFETDMSSVDFRIDIFNDSISGSLTDAYGLISYSNLPLVGGINVDSIWWWLEDYSATALTSDVLSIKAPDIDDWQFNRLMIHGPDRGMSFSIEGYVISAVPEPGTLLLFGLGFLLLRKRTQTKFQNHIGGSKEKRLL